MSEENTRLWNTGVDSDKEIVEREKENYHTILMSMLYLIHNIQRTKEKFSYLNSEKNFNKITEAMNPAFEDEKPFNPFDFWSGANFKLKIRKVDGFWNYDKSEFEAPAALNQDDAVIKETWAKQYILNHSLKLLILNHMTI